VKDDKTGSQTPLATYVIVAALTGLLGFAAVYAIKRQLEPVTLGTNGVAPPVPSSGPSPGSDDKSSSPRNPLATGEMQTFVFRKSPEAIPDFKFADGAGEAKTLADWKGKVVLLNLWATWCAPCRKEMPALDSLQKDLGSDKFEVVAMSVDRQGAPASKKFLDEIKVQNLKLYVESTSKSVGILRAAGLPTTILIDPEGREIGRLAGPAEWNSADAKRLIQSALK
jgi:thiol-disulfide isomerase/thioredoxin